MDLRTLGVKNIMRVIFRYSLLVFAGLTLLLVACSQGSSPTSPAPIPEPVEKEDTGKYTIDFQFVGQEITSDQKKVFLDAAKVWQKVITADLRDIEINIPAGTCGDTDPGFSGTIDDILIVVSATNIDGPKGVLGTSGPCGIRGDSKDKNLPFYGQMAFDIADIEIGETDWEIESLILHEMGHVLGIGTLWELFEVISGAGSDNPEFIGKNALAEWHDLGGTGNVPVENKGSSGTRDGHWRESTFDTELMTAYSDEVEYLSRLTIASLKDLTYNVDFSIASSYTLPSQNVQTLSDDNSSRLHSTPTSIRFYE